MQINGFDLWLRVILVRIWPGRNLCTSLSNNVRLNLSVGLFLGLLHVQVWWLGQGYLMVIVLALVRGCPSLRPLLAFRLFAAFWSGGWEWLLAKKHYVAFARLGFFRINCSETSWPQTWVSLVRSAILTFSFIRVTSSSALRAQEGNGPVLGTVLSLKERSQSADKGLWIRIRLLILIFFKRI